MNLLTDPLFPILTDHEERQLVDLPTLLGVYANDLVIDLPFLRPHQRAPWHSFCVHLAALALHRAECDEVVIDPQTWRELLRRLTPEWPGDEPWRLVVEDVNKPAFMQPPVPLGGGDPHRTPIGAADDLDVLVTAKNHGVKQGIGTDASPAAWVAALVLLQTTGGFLGAGNYGIARMNGGFATRPWAGLVPPGGPGAHWRRDVTVLLRRRDWFFERVEAFAEADGAALLWCLPWDGERSLGFDQLDPWFIEIGRRVRLYRDEAGSITARSVGSSAARVAAKSYKGNVGDPWIPINLEKESAAYNTAPRYAVMSAVLFERDRWLRPLLLDWHPEIDGAPMTARFNVFVRGQGKTEGYHERAVPMNARRLRLFARPEDRDRLAQLAKGMIQDVRAVLGGKMLRTALLSLVQGGPDQVKFGDRTGGIWAEKFLDEADREVDRNFFDHLFTCAEDEDAGRGHWLEVLRDLARTTFERAVEAAPLAGARRPRAIAVAERILWGAFYRTFPELRPAREETVDAA